MRVYLPLTMRGLARAGVDGRFAAPGALAHAVTGAVREWYTEGEEEELEYAAATDAAEASLHLLAADPGSPRRRVVVAADVDDDAVRPLTAGGELGTLDPAGPEGARSAVRLVCEVRREHVVSLLVDEPEVAEVVAASVAALPAALQGDEDALFAVGEAEGCDLLWFDVTELGQLAAEAAEAEEAADAEEAG